MKFSKLLTPTLTIASVGCIVSPLVTSCNNSTGQSGVQVTEAQWDEAFTYLMKIDGNTDFSCIWYEKNKEIETGDVTQDIKVTKYHESIKYPLAEKTVSEFYKNNSDVTKREKWDGTEWVALETHRSIPSDFISGMMENWHTAIPFNKFEFKNGKYVCSDTGLEFLSEISVVIIKVDNSYRISFVEAKNSEEYASMTFSNYGITTISDWPQ